MTTIIISLLCLYFISKAYETISGKKAQFNLDADKIIKSLVIESGVWSFLIPITSAIIFLYNMMASIVWIISVCINFILFIAKWIWNEIVIAGFYLVFKIIWHYLVMWPWNLFLLSFSSIKTSFTWRNLKISFLGLSFSFLLIFFGNLMVSHFEWNALIKHFFNLLSIIPIGIAIYNITKKDEGLGNANYLYNLLYIIGILFLVLGLEFIILYVGSLTTNYSYVLSSVFLGGSIIGSSVLIFNAALLIFAVSALPSFSHTFAGPRKTLLRAFGHHLMHKWPQYILAIPCMILPIVIVSIAPYFLSHGAAFVSKNLTSASYSQRVENIEKEIKGGADYSAWMDYKTISDDSLTKLMNLDKSLLEKNIELKTVKNNSDYLNEFYEKHSNYLTAIPIFVLYKGYDLYQSKVNDVINTDQYASIAIQKNQKDTSDIIKKIGGLKERIALNEEAIAEANKNLNAVCDTSSAAAVAEVIPVMEDTTSTPVVASYDACEAQRAIYRKSIEDYSEEKKQNTLSKNRAELILTHFNVLNAQMIASDNSQKTSALLGFSIISIWLCLLMAFTLAAALSLFAVINHSIFNLNDGDKKWFIVQEVEAANKLNQNQPFLALAILIALIALTLAGINQTFNKVYSAIYVEFNLNEDSNKSDLVDSLSVNQSDSPAVMIDSINTVIESNNSTEMSNSPGLDVNNE